MDRPTLGPVRRSQRSGDAWESPESPGGQRIQAGNVRPDSGALVAVPATLCRAGLRPWLGHPALTGSRITAPPDSLTLSLTGCSGLLLECGLLLKKSGDPVECEHPLSLNLQLWALVPEYPY